MKNTSQKQKITKLWFLAISFALFLSLSSFELFIVASNYISYDSNPKTDGKIVFVGEVNTQQTFTIEEVVFEKFDMPDNNIEKVTAELTLNLSTFSTPWKELEENVKEKKSYFYIKKFPKASVRIDGAKKLESGEYETDALLTLKGIQKPVKITFSVIGETQKKISGKGVVRRSEFAFNGDGPKEEVPISFEISLPEKPMN